jgi:excinuclease UvrABC ATPase subunit
VFDFLEKGVRDQLILASIQLGELVSTKFIYYLSQVKPEALDGYSTIQIQLTEYNITINIRVDNTADKHLDLVIDRINREPPGKLTGSWFSWLTR